MARFENSRGQPGHRSVVRARAGMAWSVRAAGAEATEPGGDNAVMIDLRKHWEGRAHRITTNSGASR